MIGGGCCALHCVAVRCLVACGDHPIVLVANPPQPPASVCGGGRRGSEGKTQFVHLTSASNFGPL